MEDRMTAQQLKNSILQMAVQGKLVPQDPNDEPASVLLDRIRKEKEQLIKDGKIKKNKKESYIFRGADNLHYEQIGKEVKCIEDELPFEIPGSWCWSRFSSLYSLTSGQDLSPNNYNSDKKGIAYITGASNITDGKIEINRWTINPKSTAHFGDLLFTCKGTVGKMAFLNVEKAHIARQIMSISSPYDLDLYYLKLILRTNLNSIKIKAKSMIPGISRVDVLNILIPLPPIDEQNRIVEKIKEIEPLIEKYKQSEERLYELNSNIKEQLKKSILQYAIEGKLVPQDPNDEPASVVLDRIRKEKQKLIAEGKIKKDKNESIIYRRDNSYYEKIEKKEMCIDDEIPFDIPYDWEWVRLGSIFQHNTGKALNTTNVIGEKRKYITTSNLYWNTFKLDNIKEMYFKESEIDKCTIKKGDLLVCEGGDIGRAAIWNFSYDICIQNHIHRLRPYSELIIEFYYLIFYLYKHTSKIGGKGIGIQGLSSNSLHNLLIPLPPYNIQKNIVIEYKRINKLLS